MSDEVDLLKRVYDRFNARDMETVLAAMHEDVIWANGMEGGHVHGRDEVRSYWTRQWTNRRRPLPSRSEMKTAEQLKSEAIAGKTILWPSRVNLSHWGFMAKGLVADEEFRRVSGKHEELFCRRSAIQRRKCVLFGKV